VQTTEAPLAFVSRPVPPALELRVNFGVFAGRYATPAELDDLALALLPEVEFVTIVSEHRLEVGGRMEVSLHQVRVEVAEEHLPEGGSRELLSARLVDAAERWARGCMSGRHSGLEES